MKKLLLLTATLAAVFVISSIFLLNKNNGSLTFNTLSNRVELQSTNLIPFNGKKYFLNGPNIAWNNYGWDFGISDYGHGYDANWWENTFKDVHNYGGNSVRVWIHCAGTENPVFDANGYVTGLNNGMIDDLKDLLNRAKNNNIMVILTLWDFYMQTNDKAKNLLFDDSKMNSYLKNAVAPLVAGLEGATNLLAWEIINEPEWIVDQHTCDWQRIQKFCGLIADQIHQVSKKYVTLGSAALKWNSDVNPAEGNMWSDAKLKAASGKSKAYLDFYQIHFYDWMYPYYVPYTQDISQWKLDKLTLVGEAGKSSHLSIQDQFEQALQRGFVGNMFWAYKSGGAASWSDFNQQMKNFRDAHKDIVDYP